MDAKELIRAIERGHDVNEIEELSLEVNGRYFDFIRSVRVVHDATGHGRLIITT